MELTHKFIIVDDDSINNMLCRCIIEDVYPEADIKMYTDPGKALGYIESAYSDRKATDTVLFLDINMPTLSGWEFLDVFGQFDLGVKEKLKVYMLSSSVDPRDKERAFKNKNVLDYLEKPLTRACVETVAIN